MHVQGTPGPPRPAGLGLGGGGCARSGAEQSLCPHRCPRATQDCPFPKSGSNFCPKQSSAPPAAVILEALRHQSKVTEAQFGARRERSPPGNWWNR